MISMSWTLWPCERIAVLVMNTFPEENGFHTVRFSIRQEVQKSVPFLPYFFGPCWALAFRFPGRVSGATATRIWLSKKRGGHHEDRLLSFQAHLDCLYCARSRGHSSGAEGRR